MAYYATWPLHCDEQTLQILKQEPQPTSLEGTTDLYFFFLIHIDLSLASFLRNIVCLQNVL